MSALDPEELQSFLHYGYVPRVPADLEARPWFAPPRQASDGAADLPALLARGSEAFRAACADARGSLHVVPLSGGLDSRLILGVLTQMGLSSRIVAVTYGTPGTLDYELGRAVAERAGVPHEAIDLTRVDVTRELLAAALPPEPFWVPAFEAYYNALVARRFGTSAVYWSGLMANTLNGSQHDVEEKRPRTWEETRRQFASESRAVRSVDLSPGFAAETVLPFGPLGRNARLTPLEQLALAVRYPSWYEPCLLVRGFEYRLPYCHPSWVHFTLSLPGELRRGERFFRLLAAHLAPELFRLPTKNLDGLPLGAPRWRVVAARARAHLRRRARRAFPKLGRQPAAGTNYVDFDAELRRTGPLRRVVHELVGSLERRQLVARVDTGRLWRDHVEWRANHGKALALLASLELQLAAREPRRARAEAAR